ncbi:MAG: hypothetical protein ACKOPN_01705 [Prochlorococcaceae cyanobacterium]
MTLSPPQARRWHRWLAPILMAPLVLATVTGVAGRLGRSWFGMPKPLARQLFAIHEGAFLGEPLMPVYALLLGLGLVGLAALVPLLVTAASGMAYALLDGWTPLRRVQFRWLLALHQGSWLGTAIKPVYVLLVGTALLALLASGALLLRRPQAAAKASQSAVRAAGTGRG